MYALSGSTLSLGLVGLVGFGAALVSGLIGGAVVDTYDRRLVLLGAQIVPVVASAAMLGAILTEHVSLGLIYAVVFATAVAQSFEWPARQAILPAIVPRHQLAEAVTISAAVSSFTSVTGPAVGGVLIAASGLSLAYAAHATVAALALLALLPLKLPAAHSGGRIELETIRAGLAFVRRQPVLLGAMTLDMFAVLFGGARALLPVYAVDVLHADALGYGILSASSEAGTLLMALALVALPTPGRTGQVLLASVAAFGFATVAFGISTWMPIAVLTYACVGMADQVSMVMRHTTIQLNTPDALRGRVSAVSSVFVSASNELGALESGMVAAATNAVFSVVSGGIACVVVVGLIAWLVPALRNYEHKSGEALTALR